MYIDRGLDYTPHAAAPSPYPYSLIGFDQQQPKIGDGVGGEGKRESLEIINYVHRFDSPH